MTSKIRISVYLPESVKEKAQSLAKADGRGLSNYIERLLIHEIKKQRGNSSST
jgi:hypothetical protein